MSGMSGTTAHEGHVRPTQLERNRRLDAYEFRKCDGREVDRYYRDWAARMRRALDVLADQDERMAKRLAP